MCLTHFHTTKFDLYLTASGNVKENEKTKLVILLHLVGEEGIEIYNYFTWAPGSDDEAGEDKNHLETVMQKFQQYCNPRKNTVIEIFNFWEVKQKEGETEDQFVNEFKNKSQKLRIWRPDQSND